MINGTDDTIVAISTPIGEGGIGIVRMSGRNAILIASKIFCPADRKKVITGAKSFTTHYGHIMDENGDVLDEVLLTVMRAPRTYTKEDIVEVNCHGGLVAMRKVLELTLSMGGRLARQGEFTERAFLNGRIDLSQAEAVLDIVHAKTDAGLKTAVRQLDGGLSKYLECVKKKLFEIYANIEASIDFPEDDIEVLSQASIKDELIELKMKLKKLLETSSTGIILRNGLFTVLCGRPNVGKSSLLNALLKEERAIVTPIPGTTRDVIEEAVNVRGILLRIADTAGITESQELIEQKGIERSWDCVEKADLILAVLDGSEALSTDDRRILGSLTKKKAIVVINKIDRPRRLDIQEVAGLLSGNTIVEVSAACRLGLESLEDSISDMVWGGKIAANDEVIITNIRHRDLVRRAEEALDRAIDGLNKEMPAELAAIDIKEALEGLGEVTGEVVTEDVLKFIFSQFCIGK